MSVNMSFTVSSDSVPLQNGRGDSEEEESLSGVVSRHWKMFSQYSLRNSLWGWREGLSFLRYFSNPGKVELLMATPRTPLATLEVDGFWRRTPLVLQASLAKNCLSVTWKKTSLYNYCIPYTPSLLLSFLFHVQGVSSQRPRPTAFASPIIYFKKVRSFWRFCIFKTFRRNIFMSWIMGGKHTDHGSKPAYSGVQSGPRHFMLISWGPPVFKENVDIQLLILDV